MASNTDWHADFPLTDRYSLTMSLVQALPGQAMSDAMATEQAAFTDSTTPVPPPLPPPKETTESHNYTQDEYRAAMNKAITSAKSALPSTTTYTEPIDDSPSETTTIGPYTHCHPIAHGVTSTVYRSADATTALKLITAHRPPAPHSPRREILLLRALAPSPAIIPLLDDFLDPATHRLVLCFPYKPLTFATLLDRAFTNQSSSSPSPPLPHTASIFRDITAALVFLHARQIIHRDIKPSAVLLDSPAGPAHLSDFGTAWHPDFSTSAATSPERTEPPDDKILDIGTGPYRAPDVLFVNKSYGPEIDVWALGVMLAESLVAPPRPPFHCRPAHEDGSQLGLILSIFRTIGTPTLDTWPEAARFSVSPFDMWTVFPQRSWSDILPSSLPPSWVDIVSSTVCFSKRATAAEVADKLSSIITQSEEPSHNSSYVESTTHQSPA